MSADNKTTFPIGRVSVLRHTSCMYGCFGVMFDENNLPFAVTLENEKTLIPVGTFSGIKTIYHKGGYPTFEIVVPGRSKVLLHRLNFDYQSEGCIGVGEAYQILGNVPAISQSKEGFDEFWKKYGQYTSILIRVEEHILQPWGK